jgi:hypothetical protein
MGNGLLSANPGSCCKDEELSGSTEHLYPPNPNSVSIRNKNGERVGHVKMKQEDVVQKLISNSSIVVSFFCDEDSSREYKSSARTGFRVRVRATCPLPGVLIGLVAEILLAEVH